MLKDIAKGFENAIQPLLFGKPLSKKKFCFYLFLSLFSAVFIAFTLYLTGNLSPSPSGAFELFVEAGKNPVKLFVLFHQLILETFYFVFLPMVCLDVITKRFNNAKIVLVSLVFGLIHMSNGLNFIQITPIAIATMPAAKLLKEHGLHYAIVHHILYDAIIIVIALTAMIIGSRGI